MRETPEQLRACGETFLGARRDGRLVGAVSFKRAGGTVDIHRLVVDPGAFRGGVATALLDALEAREAGADALDGRHRRRPTPPPARSTSGAASTVTEERIVPGGIRWVRMDRAAAR